MKIIFLDIDGPMLPGKAWIGRTSDPKAPFLTWDETTVRMIKSLLDEDTKLVFNSTWCGMSNKLELRAHEVGLGKIYWHEQWNAMYHFYTREKNIIHWLEQYGDDVTNWAAFDDCFNNDPDPRFIHVDFQDGISMEQYNLARQILGKKPFIIY